MRAGPCLGARPGSEPASRDCCRSARMRSFASRSSSSWSTNWCSESSRLFASHFSWISGGNGSSVNSLFCSLSTAPTLACENLAHHESLIVHLLSAKRNRSTTRGVPQELRAAFPLGEGASTQQKVLPLGYLTRLCQCKAWYDTETRVTPDTQLDQTGQTCFFQLLPSPANPSPTSRADHRLIGTTHTIADASDSIGLPRSPTNPCIGSLDIEVAPLDHDQRLRSLRPRLIPFRFRLRLIFLWHRREDFRIHRTDQLQEPLRFLREEQSQHLIRDAAHAGCCTLVCRERHRAEFRAGDLFDVPLRQTIRVVVRLARMVRVIRRKH